MAAAPSGEKRIGSTSLTLPAFGFGSAHLGELYAKVDEADIGSIEPGKLADLVVLDANPLENIRNTSSIRYAVANGVVYLVSHRLLGNGLRVTEGPGATILVPLRLTEVLLASAVPCRPFQPPASMSRKARIASSSPGPSV